MHIVLLCGTQRGVRVLRRLRELAPGDRLTVLTYPETPWEPRFVEDVSSFAAAHGVEAHVVGSGEIREAQTASQPSSGPAPAGSLATVLGALPAPDVLLAVNWRSIVPESVRSRVRVCAAVFHDSLLPEYRGFSPTVWAMVNGEDHTGVSLFRMTAEYDKGDIIAQQRVPIGPRDTIAQVTERVTLAYLDLLERMLPLLRSGDMPSSPQDEALATYTCRRLPEDNRIDWRQPAAAIYDLVRAVSHPYTGAFTTLNGRKLYIWAAEPVAGPTYAGRIPGAPVHAGSQGVTVLTGDGALLLKTVQLEGEAERPAQQVLGSTAARLG
jgi:methionyl-tRNA formyltransferase